jgi:hypothetical protein
VVVVGQQVCWIETYAARLACVAVAGGTPRVLVHGEAVQGPIFRRTPRQKELQVPTPQGLAHHEGYLYWGEGLSQGIYRIPLAGGNSETVVEKASQDPTTLRIHEGFLYWTDAWKGRISRRALEDDGQAPEVLVERGDGDDSITPHGLLVVDDRLIWSDTGKGGLHSRSLSGDDEPAQPQTLLAGPPPPPPVAISDLRSVGGLAVADEYLYWTDHQRGRIERSRWDRSDPEILVENLILPKALAMAGGYLVWTDAEGLHIAPLEQPQEKRRLLEHRDLEGIAILRSRR